MKNCPRCPQLRLAARMTDIGVEVDVCPQCKGMWLDRGEIFSFAGDSRQLQKELEAARAKAAPGSLPSPITSAPMNVLRLAGGLEIDECPKSGGIWLDAGELERVGGASWVSLKLDETVEAPEVEPDPARMERLGKIAAGLTPLPNLFLRSTTLLLFMYGILGLVLITAVEAGGLSAASALVLGIVIVALQFLFSPWLLDLSLWLMYRCRSVTPEELPAHLREFVARVCAERKLAFPRFKIIDDGAPNAFTYGHVPGNARVVITRGILELLEPAEVEAVVAHEIGHVVHWDMLLMTLAQLVPLVLYYIYRTLISIRIKGKDQTAAARLAIAVGAYVLYIVSQYLVLWFSRVREYHADRFSGRVTGNPNALASALVKIAYGLAGREPATESKPRRKVDAVGALGIFDAGAAKTLAITSGSPGAGLVVDKERLQDAMKWDLWNPWATYYEIHSTHPLVANRLSHLADQAVSMNQTPYVVFARKKPESYWDEFFVDVLVMWLPWLAFIAGGVAAIATRQPWLLGAGVAAAGLAAMLKLRFSYPMRDFPLSSVAGLLKHVKVSAVRPVPCTLRGTVIGKGVPGLVFSEDFVMQDDTGLMFMDYRQPFALWEFLFGLLRAERWQRREVTVTGWFRRAPVPFVELRSIEAGGDSSRCWLLVFKWIFAALLFFGGCALMVWLGMRTLGM
ncbi:MAG: M48 family metalloprotease [Planctomycetes bacterium]|nr:M48 family metalloprotease [Planctomycetota bacterium]